MTLMRAIFADIYARNVWGNGSGGGSLPAQTKSYRRFVEKFLQSRNIGSVVDFGCGDWQFSRLIHWGNVQYLGLDVVKSVIERNQREYQTDRVRFAVIDDEAPDLPGADLILIKDVLQHWPNRAILSFLPKLSRYRYALITNCVNPKGETITRDIVAGDFHYLDLRMPPFCCDMEKVFEYTNRRWLLGLPRRLRFRKIVLLHQADGTWARR